MNELMTKNTDQLLKKYLFTIDEYRLMGEMGILTRKQPVELLNGEIIEMSPIKSLHSGTVKLLNRVLGEILGKDFIISIQDPVELNQYSEPEPDVAVLKFREDAYTKSHPKPPEVLLIIEVADTSLEKDREVKLPIYAASGIRECWIVNLREQQIEVYTEPSEKGYADIHIYRKGDLIQTQLVPNLPVAGILLE